MAELSPAANAIWEAFNQDEPGVFVDYGDCLAAALKAVADELLPEEPQPLGADFGVIRWSERQRLRHKLLVIADSFGGTNR
jgi:hypothetical protein